MNLFSVVWVCFWCFGGTLFVILSIHLRHKAKALITKCTCNCKGILSEVCSELREYSDEDNHNRKKMFYFPVYEFEVNEKKYKTRNTIGNSTQKNLK